MSSTLYFNIIGNNNKCITKMNESSIKLDTPQNEEDCVAFNYTRDNMILKKGACLTNDFKLGTENCLHVNYYSDGIIKQDNVCYNNKTGQKEECVKTWDNYMRIKMKRFYK